MAVAYQYTDVFIHFSAFQYDFTLHVFSCLHAKCLKVELQRVQVNTYMCQSIQQFLNQHFISYNITK